MSGSHKLWGGRFRSERDPTFVRFDRSFDFDLRLFDADLRATLAHARALHDAGVLSVSEFERTVRGLDKLRREALRDPEFFDDAGVEDVHSFIESRLIGQIGEVGKKVHTGRSRNDQVATAFRLWLRDRIDDIDARARDLQAALVELAERHPNAVLPGYTHLQRAQPVLWPHWCLAYFEMLVRDRERLAETRARVNILPLGSGALAGTAYAVDRRAVARELGFADVSRNSLDAVSDRDFAVEFAGSCSLIMVHLSRLAEDMVLYCSAEFGFIELTDAVSSGSSLMPQKKNPDGLELIRGKAGRVFGDQMAMLAMLKGIPLAYNKDLQEDKEAVFDAADTVNACLGAAAVIINNTKLNEARASAAASTGYLNATEMADYLVKRGVPFRDAHETTGKAVLYAIGQNKELGQLTLAELRKFSKKFDADVFDALSLERTIASRRSFGGTAPGQVKRAIRAARKYLSR